MKLAKAMIGGLLLAVAPLAAMAEGMSYSYVEADYVDVDLDVPGAPGGDGFGLRGSAGFARNWFAFAEYDALEIDVIDIDLLIAGLGGHYGITDNLDLVGRVGYLEVDVSVPGADTSSDGHILSLGLRGRVGNAVELEGGVMQRDPGEGSDETVWIVGGRYHFGRLALGASYETGDDVNMIFVGLRYSF